MTWEDYKNEGEQNRGDNTVQQSTNRIGMVKNDSKTQMLCMHGSHNKCLTYLETTAGDKVQTGERLKVFGFMFDQNPDPLAHLVYILKKFRTRMWTIRYLKRAGLGRDDLLRAYLVFLRPVLEYTAPSFHPMLTKTQLLQLERQQRRVLRMMYGFDIDRQELYRR